VQAVFLRKFYKYWTDSMAWPAIEQVSQNAEHFAVLAVVVQKLQFLNNSVISGVN
jgi:hypothetical protein